MHVALVLLPEIARPDAEAIAAVHTELWPEAPPMTPSSQDPSDDPDDEGVGLVSADGIAHIVLVDGPVPDAAAQDGASRTLASLAQEPDLEPHTAHLLVVWSPSDALTLVEGFAAQSRLLSAVLVQTGGVGVHLPAASATHPAAYYLEVCRQVPQPMMLWTGVSHAFTATQRHRFLSYGMQQFGLPDLLLTAPADAGSDALELFFSVLSHAAEAGITLTTGDTIGAPDGLQASVRQEPNPVDPDRVVIAVDL